MADFAEVHGIVEWVGKRSREGNVWGSSEFKVKTPKMGHIFFVRSNNLCCVEVEDAIYVCGEYYEDTVEGKKIFRMTIKEMPIVEPRVSDSAIVKVFVNSMYREKLSGDHKRDFVMKFEYANRIYDHLCRITDEMEEYKGLDDSHRVNQYMTKLSNLLGEAKNAGVDAIVANLLPAFGGIGTPLAEQKAAQLLMYWYKEREVRKLLMLGLSEKEIKESPYPTDVLYRKARSNPYTIPFIDANHAYELMQRLGKVPTDRQMECGAICRYLYENVNKKGWACTPLLVAKKKFPNLHLDELTLPVDTDGETELGYDILVFNHKEKDYIYFNRDYKVEKSVFDELVRIGRQLPNMEVDPVRFRESLSEDQEVAVKGILRWPVSVLTGSGGTGKTATITEVVKNLIVRNKMFVVTSFTGRAVSRVKQEMRKAGVRDFYRLRRTMTMHRAIYKGLPCEDDELTHLIIDESSMVTTKLLSIFLNKFKNIQWILFVGDCNQLLPIEWGCLFKNIIESNTFPVYRLTKVHRVVAMQGIQDGITRACQTIAEAPENTKVAFTETQNFQLLPGDCNVLYSLLNDMHTAGVTDDEITVITPFNKTVTSVNEYIQSLYRQGADCIQDSLKRKWCVGDRVVMLENNYDINVMNGDEGRILGILRGGKENGLLVGFDDGEEETNPLRLTTQEKIEEYVARFKGTNKINLFSLHSTTRGESFSARKTNVGMLQHGYSITVHKGQGSEWPFSILYIPPECKSSRSFLCRNLLYTGSSRGKRCLRIVGNLSTFYNGCTLRPSFRHELLASMLTDALPPAKEGLDGRDIIIGVFTPQEESALKYLDNDGDFDDFDDY